MSFIYVIPFGTRCESNDAYSLNVNRKLKQLMREVEMLGVSVETELHLFFPVCNSYYSYLVMMLYGHLNITLCANILS